MVQASFIARQVPAIGASWVPASTTGRTPAGSMLPLPITTFAGVETPSHLADIVLELRPELAAAPTDFTDSARPKPL